MTIKGTSITRRPPPHKAMALDKEPRDRRMSGINGSGTGNGIRSKEPGGPPTGTGHALIGDGRQGFGWGKGVLARIHYEPYMGRSCTPYSSREAGFPIALLFLVRPMGCLKVG